MGLPHGITFVAVFLFVVFLLGLLAGLAHLVWRARQDRREREKEDSAMTRAPESVGRRDP